MATSMSVLLGLSCLTFVYVVFVAGVTSDEEFEGSRTLTLEHAFNIGPASQFVKRGTISVQSLKGSKAIFTPVSSLSRDEIQQLRLSAKNDGLYRVRIPVKGTGDAGTSYVSSDTKACEILESGLQDEITVTFDQSGEVLGLSIRANVPACTGLEVPDTNLTSWKTSVEVSSTVAGPSPDTQTYIEKMKRDDQEKLKNQDGDNRSFLSKYIRTVESGVRVVESAFLNGVRVSENVRTQNL